MPTLIPAELLLDVLTRMECPFVVRPIWQPDRDEDGEELDSGHFRSDKVLVKGRTGVAGPYTWFQSNKATICEKMDRDVRFVRLGVDGVELMVQ